MCFCCWKSGGARVLRNEGREWVRQKKSQGFLGNLYQGGIEPKRETEIDKREKKWSLPGGGRRTHRAYVLHTDSERSACVRQTPHVIARKVHGVQTMPQCRSGGRQQASFGGMTLAGQRMRDLGRCPKGPYKAKFDKGARNSSARRLGASPALCTKILAQI